MEYRESKTQILAKQGEGETPLDDGSPAYRIISYIRRHEKLCPRIMKRITNRDLKLLRTL